MSLFKLENVLLSNVTSKNESFVPSIDSMTTMETEDTCSFMEDAYQFVLYNTHELNEANKEFYKNILESGDNQDIINESFDGFFNKAKEIIKKFIEFIKKIFNKFIAKINSLFKSEKYLIKHKNDFAKFNTSTDEFSFKGYNFTNLYEGDIPKSNALSAWSDGTDFTMNGLNVVNDGDGSAETALTDITNKYDKYTDSLDDFYDKFRGEVLGLDYDVSPSDFDEECRQVFRDGTKDVTSISVDSTYVSSTYTRFSNYEDLKKCVEKTKQKMEQDYHRLEDVLSKALKTSKVGSAVTYSFNPSSSNTYASGELGKYNDSGEGITNKASTTEINTKIDMYLKAKITQIQQMSSIHSVAFAAKLTAAKDCMLQDKAVLYKALAKIKSHKKEA